jgi:hypothetical protein
MCIPAGLVHRNFVMQSHAARVFGAERMKISTLLLSLLLATNLAVAPPCFAQAQADIQSSSSATPLKFQWVMATRPGDQRLYMLVGGGFIHAPSSGDLNTFISGWLAAHPAARITPISRTLSTNRVSGKIDEVVYIWIEEGEQSLNVDVIREGLLPGALMYDMVDNAKGLDQFLRSDPKLVETLKQIEQERAEYPQDRTERLVSDADYRARMQRVGSAEALARADKLGIWSDAMSGERRSDGYR